MEVYFTGTIERIIFENVSNFYRILLLDIEDTNAEDFDDFEIIVTGTMADVIEGEEYTFWGADCPTLQIRRTTADFPLRKSKTN